MTTYQSPIPREDLDSSAIGRPIVSSSQEGGETQFFLRVLGELEYLNRRQVEIAINNGEYLRKIRNKLYSLEEALLSKKSSLEEEEE